MGGRGLNNDEGWSPPSSSRYVILLFHWRCLFLSYRLMITYTTDLDEPAWKGYMYAGILFVAAELQSVVLHQHWDVVFTLGMRVRSSVIATVYTKVCTYI